MGPVSHTPDRQPPPPTPPLKGRGFNDEAVQLAGHTALLLGWKPDDFWHATPAELMAIIAAFRADDIAADSDTLSQLLKQYPDVPTGGE